MSLAVHFDYETRSRADLPSVGAYRYACDESTEILMFAVREIGTTKTYLWVNPKFQTAEVYSDPEALPLLKRADIRYAHNSPFEAAISWALAEKTLGFKIPIDSFRCTAAMARKAGLPYSLEKLGDALNLTQQKDPRGKKLIKLFCEPQKDGKFTDPRSKPDDWFDFAQYNRTDVDTEAGAHTKLKAFELTGEVLETFQFDLRMNERGIPVNRQALVNAQRVIQDVQSRVTAEFQQLTGLNPTQREKVRELVGLPDMQAETVELALADTALASSKRRILELYSKLSFAAIKKVDKMLETVCPDGRLRGSMLYYGAGTGRWSARGVQVHNAKKPTAEHAKIADRVYQRINDGVNAAELDVLWGEPLGLIASCIRNFIDASPRKMLDGDYNAIEGRIACWIAKQDDILACWARGDDLYIRAVAFVEETTEEAIKALPKEVKGEKRAFGKVVELAAQFGLGDEGFMRTCANWGIPCDLEKAHRAVHEYYRPTHPKIVNRWWQLDKTAREAIRNPGRQCGTFIMRQIAGMNYLLMKLPSGRQIAYPKPEINKREPTVAELKAMREGKKFNEERFQEITYWGQLPMSQQWGRIKIHGSKFFENEVQGIAADAMSYGARTAEKRGFEVDLLVHDQALSPHHDGQTVEDYTAAFVALPPWAKGLCLKFEAKLCNFYRK